MTPTWRPVTNQMRWVVTVGVLMVLGVCLFVAFDQFSFELRKDERFYWPVAERFAREFPPSVELLRGYDVPTTPLTFIVFGAFERVTGAGVRGARFINLALCLIVSMMIARPREGGRSVPVLCVAGLWLFPYFLGAGIHFYTDMLAVLLGLVGLLTAQRGRGWSAAMFWTLAIATRQYLVAFPVAMVTDILLGRSLPVRVRVVRCLPYTLAAATLLGWFAFWGGLAPPAWREIQPAQRHALHPDHVLYFLSCIGAYFVVVEAALFRQFRWLHRVTTWQGGALILVVSGAFLAWPPRGHDPAVAVATMGYLDIGLRWAFPDVARIIVFGVLALIAVLRFRGQGLAEWLLWSNALVLLASHIAWDKYAIPLLAALWMMRAEGTPDAGESVCCKASPPDARIVPSRV